MVSCFLKMPYSYYGFIRITMTLALISLAYIQYTNKHHLSIYGLLIVALLFNPIIPFRFPKVQWQSIDLYTGLAMIIWIFYDFKTYFKGKKNLEIAKQRAYDLLKEKC